MLEHVHDSYHRVIHVDERHVCLAEAVQQDLCHFSERYCAMISLRGNC